MKRMKNLHNCERVVLQKSKNQGIIALFCLVCFIDTLGERREVGRETEKEGN